MVKESLKRITNNFFRTLKILNGIKKFIWHEQSGGSDKHMGVYNIVQ